MKQYVKIGSVEFTQLVDVDWHVCASSKELWDCYRKPSLAKKRVWNTWVQFFNAYTEYEQIGVRSYNAYLFTIDCVAYVPELNESYYFLITPTRREIHKLV